MVQFNTLPTIFTSIVPAERLGLPPPLPYLSIIHMFNITSTDVFLRGISFASGGAGLLDSTNKVSAQSLEKHEQSITHRFLT